MTRSIQTSLLVLIFTVITGAGVWVRFYALETAGADPDRYLVETASLGEVHRTISSIGKVQPRHVVRVGAEVSGTVSELFADHNDLVEKGQLLARLDSRSALLDRQQAEADFTVSESQIRRKEATLDRTKLERRSIDLQITSAQTSMRTAQATLDDARRKLARARQLVDKKVLQQTALDDAEIAVVNTEGRYEEARAALLAKTEELAINAASIRMASIEIDEAKAILQSKQAALSSKQVALEQTNIMAPVSGIILNRLVEVGQVLNAQMDTPTLYVLAEDITELQLQVRVDETDIGQIEPGQSSTFTVDAFPSEEFSATIEEARLEPMELDGAVFYTVIAGARNPERLLLPGMTAVIETTIAERDDVLRIPEQALRFTPSDDLEQSAEFLSNAQAAENQPDRNVHEAAWIRLPKDLSDEQADEAKSIFWDAASSMFALRADGLAEATLRARIAEIEQGRQARLRRLLPDSKAADVEGAAGWSIDDVSQLTRFWRLDDDGVPIEVDAIVGLSDGNYVEVLFADISPGQSVVVGLAE